MSQTVSELPYAVLKRLADQLDQPNRGNQPYWRELIKVLPDCPYDPIAVEKFGMHANRVDGSPAYALLTDLSNRGMTYSELVSLLKTLKHFAALGEMGYAGKLVASINKRYVIKIPNRKGSDRDAPKGYSGCYRAEPGAHVRGYGRTRSNVHVVQGTQTHSRSDVIQAGHLQRAR